MELPRYGAPEKKPSLIRLPVITFNNLIYTCAIFICFFGLYSTFISDYRNNNTQLLDLFNTFFDYITHLFAWFISTIFWFFKFLLHIIASGHEYVKGNTIKPMPTSTLGDSRKVLKLVEHSLRSNATDPVHLMKNITNVFQSHYNGEL